jgi:phosphoribosylformylglycinamidine synthase
VKLSANWMAAAGYPGEDDKLYKTVHALATEFCPALGICIPVGKDSLSMTSQWRQGDELRQVTAPLSLVISAFAPVIDVARAQTPMLRLDQGPSQLLLVDLGREQQRLGGSALAQVYQCLGEQVPDIQAIDLANFFQAMQTLVKENKILAYHDRSDGGLLVTLLEMAFAGHCGIAIESDPLVANRQELIAALFNEELGAVLQVRQTDVPAVLDCFAAVGLDRACYLVGKPQAARELILSYQNQLVLRAPIVTYHQLWAETSYRLQALRDNPDCARQEFAGLQQQDNPGLRVKASFAVEQDISAPFINSGAQPKVAIFREQGVNGQVEMAAAFDRVGFTAVDLHMSDLTAGASLEEFKGLVACGGFSYGDVLGAGQGWAKSILFNEALKTQLAQFFQRKDTFTLGVCNGCQMLAQLKSIIPGAALWPSFGHNRSEQFEGRLVLVEIADSPSILLQDMAGSYLPVPVAHAEGLVQFASIEQSQGLLAKRLTALYYVDNQGHKTETYPANPNGSPQGMAGFCSADGRVTIMMPHPERIFRSLQNTWRPYDGQDDGPWLRMFANARCWVG